MFGSNFLSGRMETLSMLYLIITQVLEISIIVPPSAFSCESNDSCLCLHDVPNLAFT